MMGCGADATAMNSERRSVTAAWITMSGKILYYRYDSLKVKILCYRGA